ncbi:MAG: 1,4-alpha-glucan-branching enzyme, partial [Phycisphaerae bacterium]
TQHGASASLREFANGHEYFGFTRGKDASGRAGVWYREWAPGATRLALIGEFNFWDKHAHVMTRDDFGVWSVFVPDEGKAKLNHDAKVKVHVVHTGGANDRIPAYIRRVTFDKDGSNATGRVWLPTAYQWKHEKPAARGEGVSTQAPRIYEAHTGMALEEERVGTYDEFRELILPRIAKAGYNAVQL